MAYPPPPGNPPGSYNPYPTIPPPQPYSRNWGPQHQPPKQQPPPLPPRPIPPPPPLPPRSPQPPTYGFPPTQNVQNVTTGFQRLSTTDSSASGQSFFSAAAQPQWNPSQGGPGITSSQHLSPSSQPWQNPGQVPYQIPASTGQTTGSYQQPGVGHEPPIVYQNQPQVPYQVPASTGQTAGFYQQPSVSHASPVVHQNATSNVIAQPQAIHSSGSQMPSPSGQYGGAQKKQQGYAGMAATPYSTTPTPGPHTFPAAQSESSPPTFKNAVQEGLFQQPLNNPPSSQYPSPASPPSFVPVSSPSPQNPYHGYQFPPPPPSPNPSQQSPGYIGSPKPIEAPKPLLPTQSNVYAAYTPQPSYPPLHESPISLQPSPTSYPGSPKPLETSITPTQSPVYTAYHPGQSSGEYKRPPPPHPSQPLAPYEPYHDPSTTETLHTPVELDSTPAISKYATLTSPGFVAELEAPGPIAPPNADSDKEVVVSFSNDMPEKQHITNPPKETWASSRIPYSNLTEAKSEIPSATGQTNVTPPPQHQTREPRMITDESEIYTRILDPPTNIPAEHLSNYYMLRKCSYPTEIAYPAFWFRTASVQGFNVCTYCFETHIRNSHFSSMFEGKLEPAFSSMKCNFGVPRVERMLWPLALQTNNFASLKAYMERRTILPRCLGPQGIIGSKAQGLIWYSPRNSQALGFVSCETCYEEQIKGTSFALSFERCSRIQGPNETWECDVSFPYMRRALNYYSYANLWPSFVTSATRRQQLPVCAGLDNVITGTRNWYTPAKPIKGGIICEACYLDQAGLTDFEREFVPFRVGDDTRNQNCNCDFWPLALKVSMEIARDKYNFSIFWDAFNVFANSPVCTSKGITNGSWYTLKGGCENFDICASCYTGWVKSVKMTQHFVPRTVVAPGAALMCDFNPESSRFVKYINKYAEAISTPNFAVFPDYVHRVATLPICQTTEFVANRRWWILQNLDPRKTVHVCESCYEDAIRGTARAHILMHTPAPLTEACMCEMYSENMRARWTTLAEAKNPDIEAFVAYCQHRNAVYMQTVPPMKAAIAQARLRLQQQQMLNSASTFYNTANALTAPSMQVHYGASTPENNYLYGNSSVGYNWETPYGVEGAVLGQQALELVASGMADVAMVADLEKAWKEVE